MADGPVRRIVVLGVSGSGKTTVGIEVADRLGSTFLDADDYHPERNVAKMSAGVPLDDADRAPWLDRLRDVLSGRSDVVLACSALKRRYRDVLRGAGGVGFVFLDLDVETACARLAGREGHFMRADMVESQFEALERPTDDEADVVTVDAGPSVGEVVDATLRAVDRVVDAMADDVTDRVPTAADDES